MVQNLPTKQEMWVRSLGGKYPLEKEMATQSRILALRIPWTEEAGGLSRCFAINTALYDPQLVGSTDAEQWIGIP